ncbi:MAG TPA: hypothetical protein VHT51_16260 [Micropepsaceae bacterium]|jgi:hypothetical protein|nr:hypothetical protein [Micropepsaceae bacterium]
MTHLRYFTISILIVPLPILLGFLFAGSEYYYRLSSSFEDVLLDRQFTAEGINADIVFVGDSSLMTGVKPKAIQAATGMTAYSLSSSIFQFMAAGDHLVDSYLAKNRAPRLIVVYIAPWTRVNPPFAYPVEWEVGAKALVRNASLFDGAVFFARHPEVVLQLPQDVWRRLTSRLDWQGNTYKRVVAGLEDERGWFAMDGPVLRYPKRVLPDGCAPVPLPARPDKEFIAAFRRRMMARNIAVALYIAPTPDCASFDTSAETAYAGIADDQPYRLPHRYFIDDRWRIHLTQEGAEANTKRVIDFVKRFMAIDGIEASRREQTAGETENRNFGR